MHSPRKPSSEALSEIPSSASASFANRVFQQFAAKCGTASGASIADHPNPWSQLLPVGDTEDSLETLKRVMGQVGLSMVQVKDYEISDEVVSLLPISTIFRLSALPLSDDNGVVTVAISNPLDMTDVDEIQSLLKRTVKFVLCRRTEILDFLRERFGMSGDTISQLVAQEGAAEVQDTDAELTDDVELAKTASVIRLVNELLDEAVRQAASDIHIEPSDKGLSIRFRIDGLMQNQPVPVEIARFFASIVTRLKIMAGLNIAEKRRPQDGRLQIRISGREIDVRVSIVPTLHGEGVVLRILDRGNMVFDLASIGMPAATLDAFRQVIRQPHGVVLVTGPTGSGKTSTLYCALQAIRNDTTKIITVEDPVEYQLAGTSQIQVHEKTGVSFASGLRSILRHDPDVILIGEIRDLETAESAIQAALTGHMVFSTLHTNDAASAFTRLVDMGVEPYLVSSTVRAVLAQRLVRRLCNRCKSQVQPESLKVGPAVPSGSVVYEPVGCGSCRETGFQGRSGLFELLIPTETIRAACVERQPSSVLQQMAIDEGMISLRQAGLEKVYEGVTSLDEVLRITTSAEAAER